MDRTLTLNRRLGELETNAAQNESEIVAILEELRTSPITLAILQHTKIGLTVNRVRKCAGISETTNQRALRLIAEWKELAKVSMATAAAGSGSAAGTTNGTPALSVATAASSTSVPMSVSPSPRSANPSVSPQPTAASSSRTTPSTSLAPSPTSSSSSTTPQKRKADLDGREEQSKKTKTTTAASHTEAKSAGSNVLSPSRSSSSASAYASPPPPAAAAASSSSPLVGSSRVTPSPLAFSLSQYEPPASTQPTLYNPNLAHYRSQAAANAQRAAAPTVVDHTSRKKTGGATEVFAPSTPSSTPPVSLCSLEQMCCDHLAAHLDRFSFLDVIPVSCMLKCLAKATAEQLTRFEKANPRLLGETESLWRALCKKAYPSLRESEFLSSSTWKQVYIDQSKKKEDKLAAVSQRLKMIQENVAHEKQAAGVKSINLQSAVKLENKGKRIMPAAASGSSSSSSSSATNAKGPYQISKLTQLKQQAHTQNVKLGYSSR